MALRAAHLFALDWYLPPALLGWSWQCHTWSCVKPVNGPVYMLGQCFLLFAGFLADTMFIRTTLIVGAVLTCVWNELGTASFPDFVNGHLPGIKVDAYVWCLLSVLVNGTPAVRQFLYNDAKVNFGGPHEDVRETMWRIWYRRTGVSRADFALILAAGEFVELGPGQDVPMADRGPGGPACGQDAAAGDLGDTYYYVCGGVLEGSSPYPEGATSFESHAGDFVNMFALLALLGNAPAAVALQTGPPSVRVAANSTFSRTLLPPESHGQVRAGEASGELSAMCRISEAEADLLGAGPGGDRAPGALLFRWRRGDLAARLFGRPSFAPEALRLAVGQAAVDALYKTTLDAPGLEKHRRAYFAADLARRRASAAELPRDAAAQKRPLAAQVWLSLKRPWRITPQERAANAVRCGSRELQRMEQMRLGRATFADMRRVASAAYEHPGR